MRYRWAPDLQTQLYPYQALSALAAALAAAGDDR